MWRTEKLNDHAQSGFANTQTYRPQPWWGNDHHSIEETSNIHNMHLKHTYNIYSKDVMKNNRITDYIIIHQSRLFSQAIDNLITHQHPSHFGLWRKHYYLAKPNMNISKICNKGLKYIYNIYNTDLKKNNHITDYIIIHQSRLITALYNTRINLLEIWNLKHHHNSIPFMWKDAIFQCVLSSNQSSDTVEGT
jgi:ribosomal silencing factor RsfS